MVCRYLLKGISFPAPTKSKHKSKLLVDLQSCWDIFMPLLYIILMRTVSTGLGVSIGRVVNSIVYLQKSGSANKASCCCRHCCFWRCCKVLQAGQACTPEAFGKIIGQKSKAQKVPSARSTNHKIQQFKMNPDC